VEILALARQFALEPFLSAHRMSKSSHQTLLDLLDHRFVRPELLYQALTHPSLQPGGGGRGPYERLEFLGDRVLGLVVAEMLYQQFPEDNEGALARRHAALVRREALARVARAIGLGEALSLSRSEEDTGGRHNLGTLADACEAVLGALYADGGLAPAAALIRRLWTPLMTEMTAPPKDAKTALQEWAQARAKGLPVYRVLAVEGPPHSPDFLVGVEIEGVEAGSGRGSSKRAAEQAAATALLEQLEK
jgi:ribonuclease-3